MQQLRRTNAKQKKGQPRVKPGEETVFLNIRLGKSTKASLTQVAKKLGLSPSTLSRTILDEWVNTVK